MSIFDFPRINFKGTIQLNPGTANNDDYAPTYTLPASWGPPFAGMPLALIDSKTVQARTYGMSDYAFMAWVQQAQTFDVVGGSPCQTAQAIPAEWNYYGGMEMSSIAVEVIGVQKGPGEIYSDADDAEPLTNVLGAVLAISNGHITDVNSEGSPPATQFFIDGLTLTKDGATFINGKPTKGACQWLNFYRNGNLTADGGAGGYVYHVMRKSQTGTIINIPGFEDPKIVGAILRYYLSRPMENANTNSQIEALYQNQQANPATLEIVGTIAPLYENEQILTTPTGRLMVSDKAQIPTPPGSQNNGNGLLALAPAVLQVTDNIVSADFVGTFPDYYQGSFQPLNGKYYFGEVSLRVSAGTNQAVIGAIDYANTTHGDRRGWVLDFDISSNAAAQEILQDPNASFQLVHPALGVILNETDYYFVSNQQGIYAEQHGDGSRFLNQGTLEPATISVFRRGLELSASECPPITVWQYRSIPLQDPGNAVAIFRDFKPGQQIVVDTSQPGNFLFTFSIEDANLNPPFPPPSYLVFMNPPYVTNAPSISLRILPNDEDFSQYFVDPNAADPVGNDLLTFDVLYEKVLRTYYLLYPVMIPFVKLNSEADVTKNAQAILQTTDPSVWMTADYMPRTRDMSASRVRLLQAWCRKVQPTA